MRRFPVSKKGTRSQGRASKLCERQSLLCNSTKGTAPLQTPLGVPMPRVTMDSSRSRLGKSAGSNQ